MARSLTVPFTARSPILPPGKMRGRTTKESVVNASRAPLTETTAPSWRCSNMEFEKAGMKIFSMSWWVRRPPPPCARTMRSSATRGTGQFRVKLVGLPSAIVIVGRARALRRYHGSAQRVLGRALYREGWTFVGLFDALENHPADAFGRFARRFAGEREAPVGVIFLEAPAQLEAAGRNLAQPPPLPRNNFEYFFDPLLCRTIPFPPHRPHILILNFVPAFLQLAYRHVNAFEKVERLESRHDNRHVVLL